MEEQIAVTARAGLLKQEGFGPDLVGRSTPQQVDALLDPLTAHGCQQPGLRHRR